MTKRIGLHEAYFCGEKIIISTVELAGGWMGTGFETVVMFLDGETVEEHHTSTLEEAKKMHNEVMRRWNDKLYEGSTAQLLGVANIGQFVKPRVTC